jgi:predicted nucleotidyltransferase
MALHPDFRDLLSAFAQEQVRYLLIGGYAVSFHSRPRFTKDIDLWIAGDPDNLARTHAALARFGAPPSVLRALETLGPEEILYMGKPPVRVDILRSIPGVDFEQAYAGRVATDWDGAPVMVMGLEELIIAKQAAGREQDRLDVIALEQARAQRSLG